MKVLHDPDWRSANTYQGKLAAGLERAGVDVVFTDSTSAVLLLTRQVHRHRPAIIHLHWVQDYFAVNEPNLLRFVGRHLLAWLDLWIVTTLLRCPVVWTVHNLTAHEARRPDADRRARRFLARRCAALFCHGPSGVEAIVRTLGVPPDRVVTAPHPSYADDHRLDADRDEARDQLGMDRDAFVCAFVGGYRPYKGLDDLVAAFSDLDDPEARLVLAGRGMEAVTAPDDDRVRIHDAFLPADELRFWFAAADVIVLPFRSVFTSGSLLLAMSFGKPVIATDVGLVGDSLDDAGGWLVPPADRNSLLLALNAARTADLDAMGRHNALKMKDLTPDHLVQPTLRTYQRIA